MSVVRGCPRACGKTRRHGSTHPHGACTQGSLQAAVDKRSPQRIGDGDGLMLVVQPNGSASWVLRYLRPQGSKRTDHTLGRWPTVTLAKAREKAEEARRQIADGLDPAERRATEK